ncbi:DUF2627 domain-containing protein [Alkalibacillus aidingensis]|uniref:DUF2627 domain-containing protein n=1 Tax=Alkalibacillus aidingensis TaxID=2747607 RepID=UPI001660D40D|nr:DUF2627 domain-containing protein [Alkalibacillus aidingensis]
MVRLIALLIVVLPGVLAAYGIKLIRDSFFGEAAVIYFNSVLLQLFAGVIFFIVGIGFIGGFILHRDRKRNRTPNRNK